MEYFIITGASRGLGNSLCKMLASIESTVICISRHRNNATMEILKRKCFSVEWIEIDFLNHSVLELELVSVLSKYKYSNHDKLILINNAGQLQPIGELYNVSTTELLSNVSVNLIAPTILSKSILNFAIAKKLALFIVNVSSPSADIPKSNWIVYGMSKCGLNYLTSAIATEYKNKKDIKIISFYPGIMDTDMRKVNLATRPLWQKIVDWFKFKLFNHSTRKVITSDEAARKLIKVLNSTYIKNGAIIDSQKIS